MSKTHKITQLKKRIAELEAKLNRREDIGSNPFRCLVVEKVQPITIKSDRLISKDMFEFSQNNAPSRENLLRSIVNNLADNEDFLRTARVEFKVPDVNPDTVRARAAIQVLPYYGDMWEDNK